MRPIEFRARRAFDDRGQVTQNGEWVYGSLVFYGDDSAYPYKIIPKPNIDESDYVWIDTKTIGQFTGFYDKNGKKIWEGDVVRWTRKNWHCQGHPKHKKDLVDICEVYWDDRRHGFANNSRDATDKSKHIYSSGMLDFNDDRATKNIVEILGNIYEHEHLLTK